jgi:tRNA-binding EMAP/Myf-like protein
VEKEKKSDRLLVFFLDINVDNILIVIQIQNQNQSENVTVQIVLSPVIEVEVVLTGELDHGQG